MQSSQFNGQPKFARDIMATRLVTVRPETDIAQAINLLLKNQISGVPVVGDEGTYLGVFSEKCCMEVLTQTAALAGEPWQDPPRARDFMVTRLVTLAPDQDAIEAIGALLKQRISGAPVTEDHVFLGVFSEKSAMNLLIDAAYDLLPSAKVRSFMNPDRGRFITEETDLLTVARIFIDTPYRRLEVVRDSRVLGQISRRDVLRSSQILATLIRYQVEKENEQIRPSPESQRLLDARESLPSTSVEGFMDTGAATITEETDLLSIANIFLKTPYRRLPVLRGGEVVGQVSRRDVLAAVYRLLEPIETRETTFLYFSAIRDRSEAPVG